MAIEKPAGIKGQLLTPSRRRGGLWVYGWLLGAIFMTAVSRTAKAEGQDSPSYSALASGWSPDGRRIAFRSDRDGNNEIYVMNADAAK